MRRNRLYQIYDRKAEMVAGAVLQFRSDGPAIRSFFDGLAAQPDLGKHAEDYDLVLLGEQLEDGTVVPPGYDVAALPPISVADLLPRIVATGASWLTAQKEVTA